MPPQEQTPMSSQEGNRIPSSQVKSKSVLPIVLAFIVLLIISIYMIKGSGVFKNPFSKPSYTQEKVIVSKKDVAKNTPAREKLPDVFSKETPLPIDAVITESVVTQYTDKDTTLSVFSYTSSLTAKEVYDLYEAYMTKSQYVFGTNGKNVDQYLSGTKSNDDLAVTIGSGGEITTVTVTYLDRP